MTPVEYNVKDVEIAFRKLQSAIFYDKSNLILRRKLADFIDQHNENQFDAIFQKIANAINCGGNTEEFKKWIYNENSISLNYYPKKIEIEKRQEDKVNKEKQDEHLNRYITNKVEERDVIVTRLAIFADIPIELHIIDVMWVMQYGATIDSSLDKCCYGNRLSTIAGGSKVSEDKWLYKRYIEQYQQWWSNAIKKSNDILEDDESVALITLDIKDFYHSIRFNFDDLENDYPQLNLKTSPLHQVLKKIYSAYRNVVKLSNINLYNDCEKYGSLPIGLQSSPLLANWYLKDFDMYVKKSFSPEYYGRYVDDIIFVMKDPFGMTPCTDVNNRLQAYFPQLLAPENNETYKFQELLPNSSLFTELEINQIKKLNVKLRHLQLQSSKIFVHEFSSELPALELEKFEQEQKEHSSEYRFLSDEEDYNFGSFNSLDLESAFDYDESCKSRFKVVEDNRFKISVYLNKLASRLSSKGSNYNSKVVKNIFNYFRGRRIIDYYQFWEKILTIFVLAKNKKYYHDFFENVQQQLDHITDIKEDISKNHDDILKILKETLLSNLHEAQLMALSLYPDFLDNTMKDKNDNLQIYNQTFLSRTYYNIWPLQQFMKQYEHSGVFMTENELSDISFDKPKYFIPYNIKLYEIILLKALVNGSFDFNECVELYNQYNNRTGKNLLKLEIPCAQITLGGHNYKVEEINDKLILKNKTNANYKVNDVINVALVEMKVSKNILEEIYKGTVSDSKKTETMLKILDSVQKLDDTDIFVMPELSIPIRDIKTFCRRASMRQLAFIGGLEYWIKDNKVYNQIVTCIPVRIGNTYDAIPYVRLKNEYAPKEVKNIEKFRLTKPKGDLNTSLYGLFHWHNHVFTSYYCYELADVYSRTLFMSKVDAIYASVFNRDTYYFKNIIETTVRDMHCYFIQSNVSQYGDSRITQPTKHNDMNLLTVKGGNTSNNDVVVLSGELKIKALRDHQKLSLDAQLESKEFKNIPPYYNVDWISKRINDEHLIEEDASLKICKTTIEQMCID